LQGVVHVHVALQKTNRGQHGLQPAADQRVARRNVDGERLVPGNSNDAGLIGPDRIAPCSRSRPATPSPSRRPLPILFTPTFLYACRIHNA
jgi:hypothetical protein